MSFASLNLPENLLRAITELGFETPTPIQKQAIPAALEGRDLVACATTGSGKTAAFALPCLTHLQQRPARRQAAGPRVLVISPTRELAAQTSQHFGELARFTRLRGAAIFGGVAMGPQQQAFRSNFEILIATPGRLLDHLQHDYARLGNVEILVLDEADRMLDMGFLPDIRKILRLLPADRQNLLFSATMPQPIAQLAREMLRSPVEIAVERESKPAQGITQSLYPVKEELKPFLLLELLKREQIKNVIVFTRTKHRANRLADFLQAQGISSERIHGNRSQSQRTEALAKFKDGKIQVLVATDIAARGIDVEALSHVLNFDVPNVPDDYIHRVGRTARAEQTGDAWTFVSDNERNEMNAIERVVGHRIARRTLEGFNYDQKPQIRFEVPIAERIAAIRARKADERARAKAKADRRSAQITIEEAKRNGRSTPATAERRPFGRPPAPTSANANGNRANGNQRPAAAGDARMSQGRPGQGRPAQGRPANDRPSSGRPGARPTHGRPTDGRTTEGRASEGRSGQERYNQNRDRYH